MGGVIDTMITMLEKNNCGFVSLTMGKHTIMITDDLEGAEYLKNAWDTYVESEEE